MGGEMAKQKEAVGEQLTLPEARTWGGRRANAGRKRGIHIAHGPRPEHDFRHPVHITLRAVKGLPSFRTPLLYGEIERSIRATRRPDFRINEFSVQDDHVHLISEGDDKRALSRGMSSFKVRAAARIKRALGLARGPIWQERYHRRDLTSPKQVRNALVYVIANYKKHFRMTDGKPRIDACSSAPWFAGWISERSRPPETPSPVEPSCTWLGRTEWKRHGLIHPGEAPRTPHRF
ncbi:transposase [Labilithrix luteola]|uniref:transposase n=1 Tax=Labilithrix luteola TaxID=1391654 RepID=UPI003B839286